ncbi:hypothetical protein DFH11DRAFT_1503478 [Phellopilus nigrolimitatus]|nr:hypothetical protein DFH11DRAFT_1503478 [Phellopilus nigrolimitatus]
MSSTNIRQPYKGSQLGIVIGIDVGTTFSGVSYAILRPGVAPEVQPVTRFSGDENHKIPSVIFYDDELAIKAIGPSTIVDFVLDEAEEHGWFESRYFKMLLRPNSMALQTNGLEIGGLPPGKSAEEVMGDFLNYLFVETASYIQSSHADGADIWHQVKDRAILVLGHPNGWTGLPQQRYRNSAILGGLIPDTDEGRKRVKFVTEGEASALTCLSGGLGPARLEVGARMDVDWAINQMSDITKQVGFRFVIADAGGGTLDFSSYEVSKSSPVELRQCAPADCQFAGSLFVNRSGLELLKRKLRNSSYDYDDVLGGFINDEFEKKTKREFGGDSEYGLLKVGDRRTAVAAVQMTSIFYNSDELSECFSMSVTEALDSIRSQVSVIRGNNATTPVWLVGGFASSRYLLYRLNDSLKSEGVSIQRPDTNLEKAVANGAVLHFLDNSVTARVCPASYGIACLTPFNSSLSDHRAHHDLIHRRINGLYIGPIFDCVAEKGTLIVEARVFKKSYVANFFLKFEAKRFTTEILVYNGDLPLPKWYKENKDKFRTLCKLEADLFEVCTESPQNASMPETLARWRAVFEIELKFGTTQLEARIKWEANVCIPSYLKNNN